MVDKQLVKLKMTSKTVKGYLQPANKKKTKQSLTKDLIEEVT